MDRQFWKGKTVLITGQTGFVGSWLSMFLIKLGARVVGYSRGHVQPRSNFSVCGLSEHMCSIQGDIQDRESLEKVFKSYKPEYVFHMAAQSLAGISMGNPYDTFRINLLGTINLLEYMRGADYGIHAVFASTEQMGWEKNRNRYNPYSSSKMCEEIAIHTYRNLYMNPDTYMDHNKSAAVAYAGNIIGGGDWASGRIVPDCIRALEKGEEIILKTPHAEHSWVHILDAVHAYLVLAQKAKEDPKQCIERFPITAGENGRKSVSILVQKVTQRYTSKDPYIAYPAAMMGNSMQEKSLEWNPILNFEESVGMTVEWYKKYCKEDMFAFCMNQIQYFIELLQERKQGNDTSKE